MLRGVLRGPSARGLWQSPSGFRTGVDLTEASRRRAAGGDRAGPQGWGGAGHGISRAPKEDVCLGVV